MARGRHTPDLLLAKLKGQGVLLVQGDVIAEVTRNVEVSEQTHHRWKNPFCGMKGEEMERPKPLERENGRQKRVVADLALDVRMLKDIAEANA